MEIMSTAKYVKVTPRKVRLVAEVVRRMNAQVALAKLAMLQKSASDPLAKAIKSAVANAAANNKLEKDTLVIKTIIVEEGPAFKRFRPASRGRAHSYKKRMSHIKVVLEEAKKK